MNSNNSPKERECLQKTQPIILPKENHSMLTNPSREQWQDKKRTLVCLLKWEWERRETAEQFAQRVWEAWEKSPHNPNNRKGPNTE